MEYGKNRWHLVYHAGALGDFVTTLPALAAFRKAHPEERIVLLGRPEYGFLAQTAGYVDSVLDVASGRYLPLWQETPSREAAAFLAGAGEALIFAGDDMPLLGHLRSAGVRLRSQPPFPADRIHVVEYHLQLFPELVSTIPPGQATPEITVTEEDTRLAREYLNNTAACAVIQPGSGSRRKNWPETRFREMAAALVNQNLQVLWLTGPAEGNSSPPPGARELHLPPLGVLAAILREAGLFIGNDSGVTHLAAAAGCPTLALFGPSDPLVWAPRGRLARILYRGCPLAPCHPGPAPQDCAGDCLRSIGSNEAMESALALLSSRHPLQTRSGR